MENQTVYMMEEVSGTPFRTRSSEVVFLSDEFMKNATSPLAAAAQSSPRNLDNWIFVACVRRPEFDHQARPGTHAYERDWNRAFRVQVSLVV